MLIENSSYDMIKNQIILYDIKYYNMISCFRAEIK